MMRGCLAFLLLLSVMPGIAAEPELPTPGGQYKRIHQDWLEMIVGDKAAQAEKEIAKSLKAHPDPESYYMLAVAQSEQGKTDEALQAVRAALEGGLPPSRFFAGNHQRLDKLAATEGFAKLRDANRAESFQGPMLGRMTDTSAAVWLRLGAGESARVIVRLESDKTEVLNTDFAVADPANDDVVEIELKGLTPATDYRYEVYRKQDERDFLSEDAAFRTFPAQGKPGKFTIAFGGGAGYVPTRERMWRTIEKSHPDALLLLGDNVYIDNPQMPEMQWYCYYRRQARPEFRQLVARTPVFSIWDDHDFSTNDSWGGPEIDSPAWKRDVWGVYKNNWINPAYGGGEQQPGCWYKFGIADVEFFMLDGRYYRNSPKLPEKSRDMLGPVQEKWLLDAVSNSTATFKVICSPVPWTFQSKSDSPDTWNGYKRQRARIFDFLTAKKIEGVVLMSADRHRSDLWKIDREHAYPFYEFNSSKLTNQHTHPEMKHAEFSYNGNSFGLVRFDTNLQDPQVSYDIIDIDGKVVHTFDLPLSKLQTAD